MPERKSGPQGLRNGPWRTLLPGSETNRTELNSLNAFPAPIQVRLVVQKYRLVAARTKGEILVLKVPRTTTPPVVTVHVQGIRVVTLTPSFRRRPTFEAKLGKPFGTPTAKVNPSPAKKVMFVAQETVKRRFIDFDVIKTKVFGRPTKAPIFNAIKIKLTQPDKRQGKPVGATLFKPTKTVVVVVVVRPKTLRILLQRDKRTRVGKTRFNKVFGRPTTRPPVRPSRLLELVANQAQRKRRFVVGKTLIGKVPRTFGSSPVGSIVIFYDGLNVAGGLNYHKDLRRPHIILTPAGGGRFNVVKDVQQTEEKSDGILKETYIIDGELP